MKQNKIVRKTFEQYDNDWPSSDVIVFIAWFHSKIADVPDESRDSLTISIESETSGYDSCYATIEFTYTRLETDDEEFYREKRASDREASIRDEELLKLAELQAKYCNIKPKG